MVSFFFQLAATRSTNLCHAVETKTRQNKKKTHREKQGRAGSEGARDWERWLERRGVFSNLHAGSWVTSARRRMRSERGRSASRRDDEERFLGGWGRGGGWWGEGGIGEQRPGRTPIEGATQKTQSSGVGEAARLASGADRSAGVMQVLQLWPLQMELLMPRL